MAAEYKYAFSCYLKKMCIEVDNLHQIVLLAHGRIGFASPEYTFARYFIDRHELCVSWEPITVEIYAYRQDIHFSLGGLENFVGYSSLKRTLGYITKSLHIFPS